MAITNTVGFAQDTRHGLPAIVRGFVATVRARLAVRRQQARLFAELDSCSDRELADMNISRADIGAMVRNWQQG